MSFQNTCKSTKGKVNKRPKGVKVVNMFCLLKPPSIWWKYLLSKWMKLIRVLTKKLYGFGSLLIKRYRRTSLYRQNSQANHNVWELENYLDVWRGLPFFWGKIERWCQNNNILSLMRSSILSHVVWFWKNLLKTDLTSKPILSPQFRVKRLK